MAKQKKSAPAGQRAWRDVSVFAGGPGQRWSGPVAWILVLGVILIAALVLFLPRTGSEVSRLEGEVGVTDAPASSPVVDGSSACDVSPVDEAAVGSPGDVSWTVEYGNSWPVSSSAGPRKTVDGLGQCFARSPVGAALAAVNVIQSVRVADLEKAHRILDAQYVQNEGKTAASAGIDKVYPANPPQGRQWGRSMGFKVLAFSADKARVLLVENWPQRGQYTGFTVALSWVDGDWKVALEPSGEPSEDGTITVDPDGYTPWESAR